METKRITISTELYNLLYSKCSQAEKNNVAKKGDAVVIGLNKIYEEHKNLQEQDYIILDEDTLKKIGILVKMNINKDVDDAIKQSVKSYLNTKKEEIKKIVDSF